MNKQIPLQKDIFGKNDVSVWRFVGMCVMLLMLWVQTSEFFIIFFCKPSSKFFQWIAFLLG
eukprot:m.65786 g.65786  ORF g.65786 m.65786 type:complete len:61 (+) comp13559_c0_seq1:1066-1248(+)